MTQFPPIPDDYFAEQLQHEADLSRRFPLHRCVDPGIIDQPIGEPERFQGRGASLGFVAFVAFVFAMAILL